MAGFILKQTSLSTLGFASLTAVGVCTIQSLHTQNDPKEKRPAATGWVSNCIESPERSSGTPAGEPCFAFLEDGAVSAVLGAATTALVPSAQTGDGTGGSCAADPVDPRQTGIADRTGLQKFELCLAPPMPMSRRADVKARAHLMASPVRTGTTAVSRFPQP